MINTQNKLSPNNRINDHKKYKNVHFIKKIYYYLKKTQKHL